MTNKTVINSAAYPVRVYKDGNALMVKDNQIMFCIPFGTEIVLGTTTNIYSGVLEDYSDTLKFIIDGKEIELKIPISFLSTVE